MLHTTLKVNNQTISHFEAVRITNTDYPFLNDDDVSDYRIFFQHDTGVMTGGVVSHRYGDGGWKLLQKAIEELL